MAAAICITVIITNPFDSGISMDEIILLVIELTTVSVPRGSGWQKPPMYKWSLLELCYHTWMKLSQNWSPHGNLLLKIQDLNVALCSEAVNDWSEQNEFYFSLEKEKFQEDIVTAFQYLQEDCPLIGQGEMD